MNQQRRKVQRAFTGLVGLPPEPDEKPAVSPPAAPSPMPASRLKIDEDILNTFLPSCASFSGAAKVGTAKVGGDKTHDALRQSFGGNESIMRGFQIGKLKTYQRKIPRWVNNAEIQKIILAAFPKLKTDQKQRTGAARWANVIHFYFRLRYTARQTAEELAIKASAVNETVRSVKRAASGRRADGKIRGGKRGRPKGAR
jgi:hypothetical protein